MNLKVHGSRNLIELQDVIQTLYTRFVHYPLKSVIAGCPHCVSGDDNAQLHIRPLRQLTPDDFRRYTFNALNTWGDADDFRHFLPRIFELMASDELHHPEIVSGKLRYADWHTWDKHEIQAIRDYFIALWKHQLNQIPIGCDAPYSYPDALIGDLLCVIARAEDDLTPYLKIWQAMDSLSSVLHLVQWINRNHFLGGSVTKLGNAFWDSRPKQSAQVTDWLLRPETVAGLETAFDWYIQSRYADAIALAIDNLEYHKTVLTGR